MKIKIAIIIFSIFASLTIAGCSLFPVPQVPDIKGPISSIQKIIGQQEDLLVVKLEPKNYAAQIEYDKEGKYISEWRTDNLEIVINGGFFDEEYAPSGFLVVNGERISERLFDQDKSGLVVIEKGKVSIRDLALHPIKENELFEFALQSYPFLIKDTKPALSEDSGKKANRTVLAMDAAGNVYIIISLSEISLYEMMNKILALQTKFTAVLNLDGGPSTGIYKNWEGEGYWHEGYSKVPSIIRFKKISNFQAP